ncbi:MAG: RNA polymerase sigma factor [Acidobacteriota bacterium]|nr:RNA polymerase sigma factor [Acidobacteriota bacterium]
MTRTATRRSNTLKEGILNTDHVITDEELVELAQRAGEGDLRPFDSLVERHRGKVLANCRYLTRAAADSEDLAQEVFLKAFFALNRFEGRSSFTTWLQRIKINHCLNYIEKQKRRQVVDVEDPALTHRKEFQVASRAHQLAEASSDRERIVLILDSLAETLRVPLVLRDADGASYQEIADQLQIGLSAVKMRIKRAREEFRSRWLAAFGDTVPR